MTGKKMPTYVWIGLLFLISVVWGMLLDFTNSADEPFWSRLIAGIGGGVPVLLGSGIVAFAVYAAFKFNPTKKRTAMLVWTITLLVLFALLGLGGMHGAKRLVS